MNSFVRTPSFTGSHPDPGTSHTFGGPSPVANVAQSHPMSKEKATRQVLHLPDGKQGLLRRTWPFQGSLDSLDSLDSLTFLNR